jgi:hypothetical protein
LTCRKISVYRTLRVTGKPGGWLGSEGPERGSRPFSLALFALPSPWLSLGLEKAAGTERLAGPNVGRRTNSCLCHPDGWGSSGQAPRPPIAHSDGPAEFGHIIHEEAAISGRHPPRPAYAQTRPPQPSRRMALQVPSHVLRSDFQAAQGLHWRAWGPSPPITFGRLSLKWK